ncbi:D-amino acid dehydrogenase [Bradyrhizobium sp. U87765 SZCCT0131]|uniref:D-amino acid dehydrogenase n=1 Tax=unclassified Bradyrhizobium TaxID=2631580 RepID=UPI001BA9B689|nr:MULTISPECIES: D-amino acid dehydrogenase [unclassified Bradyrhizobium]MBR1222722.1 D-amino acid dehydrogenase [Bradyrhizobium sp. U87765 SZCCT0131]MBR1265197.1 D-amino acid dehydrogenase [Bradyrhizobium sp. U87765 SZCCT0134]MBR1303024.1 D-amino acid dehydrogenase [Bradyrhizobium sp. U87765 SZCCT0110]MBR1323722.1 D-amino acid dehydrogenase [Bradyrhizobium sp. U87765 SZCCT0109]MBR1346953.1 D-amino acid dehydrogenase [Bradyrhizobium sp. U87765 SZCCT0048]
MPHLAVIGAGITGVTTAYALLKRGHDVTVIDRHRYAAMDTSFANGGQLSASNAEVWNSAATMLKGLRWMFRNDAPLLMNPSPSWHKYSWLAEFARATTNYRDNTITTARLAIAARQHLFAMAEQENIAFDLEKRGILHIYHDKANFEAGLRVNALLTEGGLDRRAVTPDEIRSIEPALQRSYHGGFYTPSDSTGDIHKFTRGLAKACIRHGARFIHQAEVEAISTDGSAFDINWRGSMADGATMPQQLRVDGIVVCAGVGSRHIAAQLGDRINVYPVKGYSITVHLDDAPSRSAAPYVSLLDETAKIVTSRLGADRFRVAGTAEFNGFNRDIRADRIRPLTDWVERNFPAVETARVTPWAGLRPMMPDMMPVVRGGTRAGVFYNTGHGHLGWTLSAATAEATALAIDAWRPAGRRQTPFAARSGAKLSTASEPWAPALAPLPGLAHNLPAGADKPLSTPVTTAEERSERRA